MTYRAPLRDLNFALTDVVNIGQVNQGGAFADFDADLMTAVLEAAGDLATGVLAPLNRIGDKHGAVYANGKVTAAPGFADAYKAFAEGGWNSLAADPAYGGQGLPKALELAVFETIHAANMAFGLCPMLTQGAIEALHAHGSERQKSLYLPRMISGEWTGTMNLTEPQSGSDLGTLTTRAEPDGEGRYRLYGQKIYITWGDHDVADNIVHLVLARLPGAPEGVKGISLFLAPKYLTAEDGTLGAANDVRPGGIEHKLGIHASPTCIMLFEGARAELVGQEGQGLAHMFTMMNAARLNVGMQGVGIAERAYQGALAYAVERKLSRHPEEFGKGAVEGLAGPEAANNAGTAGAFVPLLCMGIPANAITALLLGAFMIHGVTPGPTILERQPEVFWGVVASMYIGNIMLLVLNLPLIGLFVRILDIPRVFLTPMILVVCLVGVYSNSGNADDVVVAVVFGFVGFFLRRHGFDLGIVILAYVLGPIFERSVRQALSISDGDPAIFLHSPLSIGFAVAAAVILGAGLWPRRVAAPRG
jgi:alkylation response protein AidB-like acyl-CoA dehydrogenase